MREHGLGPNGAIVTSLNLFATQFDQVVGLAERRAAEIEFLMVDTPGQIEVRRRRTSSFESFLIRFLFFKVFTWSASGTIISDSLALCFPTCVLYVLDCTRCLSPATFVSNMLYAVSILYKTRLPFVLALNKCDAASAEPPLAWLRDSDALAEVRIFHAILLSFVIFILFFRLSPPTRPILPIWPDLRPWHCRLFTRI